MYNQIEDILLNISIVIATVWIVKRFWGSFFEEKQNSILSVLSRYWENRPILFSFREQRMKLVLNVSTTI